MWKLLTTLASPAGASGRLSVLFFHRVFPSQDRMLLDEPTAESFDTMLGWLQSQFNVIPLAEGVRRLCDGSLPPAAAAITFDDGYRDNLEIAAPLLLRRGMPATFFISTGFLDGGIMFNDVVIECMRRCREDEVALPGLGMESVCLRTWQERAAAADAVLRALKYQPFVQRTDMVRRLPALCGVELPGDLMLTTAQVRALAAKGFDIGAHTDRHPILASLPDEEARSEMVRGRDLLQSIVDQDIPLFAYPNGRWGHDFDQRHRDMAKACGFRAAFSTEPSVGHGGSDLWKLPRFTPWDRTELKFRLRMLAWQRRRPDVVSPLATEK